MCLRDQGVGHKCKLDGHESGQRRLVMLDQPVVFADVSSPSTICGRCATGAADYPGRPESSGYEEVSILPKRWYRYINIRRGAKVQIQQAPACEAKPSHS